MEIVVVLEFSSQGSALHELIRNCFRRGHLGLVGNNFCKLRHSIAQQDVGCKPATSC